MNIIVGHKQWRQKKIDKIAPGAMVIDVTSRADMPWVKFSPFYPHGGIPLPFSDGLQAQSVEGVWQGLKVFESAEIDLDVMQNTTMQRLKRTERKFGKTLGHQRGVNDTELLPYITARLEIYLPLYLFVLERYLQDELAQLREIAQQKPLILLDYETNCDIYNPAKPLSHAGLIKAYLDGSWETQVETGWIGYVGNAWVEDQLKEIEEIYALREGYIGWDVQWSVALIDFCYFYWLQRTQLTNPTKDLNLSFLHDETLLHKLRYLLYRFASDRTDNETHETVYNELREEISWHWHELARLDVSPDRSYPVELP